jgi:hypothetical protein
MEMVEIFRTNIDNPELAKQLTQELLARFPGSRINFDLHDRDNILRVENHLVCVDEVIKAITSSGYHCHLLD